MTYHSYNNLTKNEIPIPLRSFFNYQFSSGGYIGEDFKSFNTKFRNYIKKILPNEWKIDCWNRNHYECSAVFETSEQQYVYMSIPDVRFFLNEWAENILIRTMKHNKDWTGGNNYYTNLIHFTEDIQKLY